MYARLELLQPKENNWTTKCDLIMRRKTWVVIVWCGDV
jgi:hypothetical protein